MQIPDQSLDTRQPQKNVVQQPVLLFEPDLEWIVPAVGRRFADREATLRFFRGLRTGAKRPCHQQAGQGCGLQAMRALGQGIDTRGKYADSAQAGSVRSGNYRGNAGLLDGFQAGGEVFAQLGDFRCNYCLAIRLTGVLCEIVLMVILGGPESRRWQDGSNDRIKPGVVGGERGDQRSSRCGLFFGVCKDDRAILAADIVSLPVERGGIVNGEKRGEQRSVVDDGRIEFDAHHLRVAGIAVANLRVGRVTP